jgi:hypothetical protein
MIGKLLSWFKDAFTQLLTFFELLFDGVYSFFKSWLVWLFDSLLVLVRWVWQGLSAIRDKLYEWLTDAVETLWDQIEAWLPDALLWMQEQAWKFADFIESQAESIGITIDIDDLTSKLSGLVSLYEDAAWLLPLDACLGIIGTTIVMLASIRLARWILSFAWITG